MASKPNVDIPAGAPPAELVREDLVTGTGAEAIAGKTVEVHYVGVAWSTKKQFDASWDRGETFDFPLGAGRVIRGWDEGVAGMRVGGRRQKDQHEADVEHEVVESDPVCRSVREDEAGERMEGAKRHIFSLREDASLLDPNEPRAGRR